MRNLYQPAPPGGHTTSSSKSGSSSRCMSEAKWEKMLLDDALSPGYISCGRPPVPQLTNAYPDKWRKLVWMEFLASVHEFRRELDYPKSQRSSFEKTAQLAVSVLSGPNDKGLCDVSVTGIDNSNNFALPEQSNHPSDFVHGLLKLPQGQGWVYMKKLVFPDDVSQGNREHRGPVQAEARIYTDSFLTAGSEDIERMQRNTRCILFSDFNTCFSRFEALKKYSSVASDLRAAVEDTAHRANTCECAFLLPPPGVGFESKLNANQQEIMRDVRGPIDFVQGPPGTGKSTFIVELLHARIPKPNKVLVCTTTNKAIDSLTTKIHSGGNDDVVAFGNPKRLGSTSVQLTLQQQYQRHPTAKAVLDLYQRATNACTWWNTQMQKLKAMREEVGESPVRCPCTSASDDDITISKVEEKMVRKAKEEMQTLKNALDAFINCTEHPATVTVFLAGRVANLRANLTLLSSGPISPGKATNWLEAVLSFARVCNSKVKYAVKLHIVRKARYFVCTAASAVRLQRKIAREVLPPRKEADAMDMMPEAPESSGLINNVAGAVGALAVKLGSVLKVGRGGLQRRIKAGTGRGKISEAQELQELLDFKYVVLDEAGAMLEPDMVGTIIHGCRFLLCVGDHKQLPPFTRWNQAEEWGYSKSLLQRLVERQGAAMDHHLMTMQYRMHPHIASIVSDTFYGGKLTTATSVARARKRTTPVVFVDMPKGTEKRIGTSWKNIEEARRVVEVVQSEVKNGGGGKQGSIDVLTFHKPQVFLIKDLLKKAGLLQEGKVEVMTVDSMQGREADVIVLSCVRSGQQKSIGFLRSPNRLNVGLSRAREQMYIVGNWGGLLMFGTGNWHNLLKHQLLIRE